MHSHKSAFDGCWKYSLRDVPREVVDVYRIHPKWFTGGFGGRGSEVRVGFRVQGSAGGLRVQGSGFSMSEAPVAGLSATVAGRSPDRLADCDPRSPETGDAGDLRSALSAELGDPARTGVREEVTGQRSEAREGFTAGAGGQGSEIREERGRRVPGPGFSTMSAIGPSDASTTSENVEGSQEAQESQDERGPGSEAGVQGRFGNEEAQESQVMRMANHQWHREIREYNPNYDFQT